MQIDRIFYPTKTLGYGTRVSIWTIGCPRRCHKCANPELWEANPARDISTAGIMECLEPYLSKIDGITITGGDPFFQNEALLELLLKIRDKSFPGDTLVYTGYLMSELIDMEWNYSKSLEHIDVLIDGPYVDVLNNNLGIMGSSNQQIRILNKLFADRYQDAREWQRSSQVVENDSNLISVGIPLKTPGDDTHEI